MKNVRSKPVRIHFNFFLEKVKKRLIRDSFAHLILETWKYFLERYILLNQLPVYESLKKHMQQLSFIL